MAGRSSQADNRGSDLFGFLVSGKGRQFHTYRDAGATIPSGLTATGGVISDYSDGSTVYRAHVFTTTDTFSVSSVGPLPAICDYLVVGGGGGTGSRWHSGGGGAGGLLINPEFPSSTVPASQNRSGTTFTASANDYTITIGAGGAGSFINGSNSNPPGGGNASSIAGPDVSTITANGGGYGATYDTPGGAGGSGGGGGGPAGSQESGGAASNFPGTTQQGHPGGAGSDGEPGAGNGGGGGGAGAVGQDCPAGNSTPSGHGGVGLQVLMAGPESYVGAGVPGPGGAGGWFAGGGGGGYYSVQSQAGGAGGSWSGSALVPGGPYSGGAPGGSGIGNAGTQSTGGGGGASGSTSGVGGAGGSGIVVVRYQIAELTAQAKATGGAVSFANGKTIHTFTASGAFNSLTPLTVDYLMVGGGGGGGGNNGGGGGGGGVIAATSQSLPSGPKPIVIGNGGIGAPSVGSATPGGDTTFNSLTAGGGGSGGRYPDINAGDGRASNGSGGGAGQGPSTPGSGDGTGRAGGSASGAGGGGADSDGGDQNGGRGITNSILGTSYYWAGGGGGTGGTNAGNGGQGGGGGGGSATGTAGTAGADGLFTGGDGTVSAPGSNYGGHGAVSTGGGGGGGGKSGNGNPLNSGGNGGAGIVVIAYPS